MSFKKGDKVIAIKKYYIYSGNYIKKGTTLTIKNHNSITSYEFEELSTASWTNVEEHFILNQKEMRKIKLIKILT